MADKILHKRSLTSGSIPTTSSLNIGELAINVNDGKLYLHQSGSIANQIVNVGESASFATSASFALTASYVAGASSFPFTGSALITGSLGVTGSLTATQIRAGAIPSGSTSRLTVFSTNNTDADMQIRIGSTDAATRFYTIGRESANGQLAFRWGAEAGAKGAEFYFPVTAFNTISSISSDQGTARLRVGNTGGGRTFALIAGVHNSSQSNFSLYDETAGITRFILDGSGNLGLGTGTTAPGARLDVRAQGALSTDIAFRVRNSADTSNIITVQGDGNTIFTGSIAITQNITGSRAFISSSNGTISGSSLTVYGSGSAQPVFTVQGSSGELFSITDSLSGSLFSVNDISGLPILEVFSDNTTLIGNYLDPMLITTAKVTQTNSGSFVVYSLPTASYDTAFFEYSVKSGSNARAGTIMAIQSGTSVNFTETTTTAFGSTTAISFTVVVTGSNMALTGSSTSGAWTIKSIVRGI